MLGLTLTINLTKKICSIIYYVSYTIEFVFNGTNFIKMTHFIGQISGEG